MKHETRRTTNSQKMTRTVVKDFSKLTKCRERKTLKISKETLKKHEKLEGHKKMKEKKCNFEIRVINEIKTSSFSWKMRISKNFRQKPWTQNTNQTVAQKSILGLLSFSLRRRFENESL